MMIIFSVLTLLLVIMVPTISFVGCDATIMEQIRSHERDIMNRRSEVVASFTFLSPQVVAIPLHQRVRRRRRNHHHQLSMLEMSSSSSSSSSPPRRRRVSNNGSSGGGGGSSGGGSSAGSGGRNRGANAASHNRRGHSFRISSKDSTTTTTTTTTTTIASAAAGGKWPSSSSSSSSSSIKMNNKRPPRWEREGDRLYAEVTKDLNAVLQLSINRNNDDDDESLVGGTGDGADIAVMMKPTSAQDVCRLLEPWTATIAATDSDDDDKVHELLSAEIKGTMQRQQPPEEKSMNENNESSTSQATPPPPFLWGSLPLGPVLASRLYATGRSEPTSVQRAAFSILTAAVPDNGSHISYSSNNNDRYPAISNDYSRRNRRMGYPSVMKRSVATAKKKAIKRTNAIIASPTGTGKTLAYLLPLLCTSPGGQRGEGTGGILIVTPTIELACQIQREVDVLWPPLSSSSSLLTSSLFVVGDGSMPSSSNDDDDEDEDFDDERDKRRNDQADHSIIPPGRLILRALIRNQSSPIIAGTPKMLRMLYREVGRIASGEYDNSKDIATISDEERTASIALCSNLRAIVLDEADRLLRTEAAAREATERKNRKIAQQRLLLSIDEASGVDDVNNDKGRIPTPLLPSPPLPSRKSSRLVIARQTQTEFLLRDLPVRSLNEVQIICASATVGRTMRRQLMQVLDKPSADAAATLVTGEEDVRVKSKDAERRRGALLPDKLSHAYRVVCDEQDDGEVMLGDVKETESDTTIQPSETQSMTVAERNEELRVKQTIATLWQTLMSDLTEAKPILIFPGRMGVDRVQKELKERGIEDIRTLRNLDGKNRPNSASVGMTITEEPDSRMSSGQNGNGYSSLLNKWRSMPIYIIGERFARGLDLPDVGYVFILSPPSSAAGYAHMAGRTGRCGKAGVAITLVRPKNNEVSRLASIAEALGLKFDPRLSGIMVSNR